MIGGTDLVLYGQTKDHDTDFLVRGIRHEWPNGMLQRVDEVDAMPMRSFRFPILGPAELILYRDLASYQSWRDHGATADNQDAMILVIVSDDAVTLVIDQPTSALGKLASDLIEALRHNRIVLQPTYQQAA